MSASKPTKFLQSVAQPNVEEALKRPNDPRLVFNACAAIEALSSMLYLYCCDNHLISEISDGKFKAALSRINDPFGLIHDIAEAQKHGRLTRPSGSARAVRNAEQLTPEPHGWGYARWDELILGIDSAISVEVGGQMRTVASAAHTALNFLKGEIWMAENGDCAGVIHMDKKFAPKPV